MWRLVSVMLTVSALSCAPRYKPERPHPTPEMLRRLLDRLRLPVLTLLTLLLLALLLRTLLLLALLLLALLTLLLLAQGVLSARLVRRDLRLPRVLELVVLADADEEDGARGDGDKQDDREAHGYWTRAILRSAAKTPRSIVPRRPSRISKFSR